MFHGVHDTWDFIINLGHLFRYGWYHFVCQYFHQQIKNQEEHVIIIFTGCKKVLCKSIAGAFPAMAANFASKARTVLRS